jgi:hypothetical protein
MKKFSNQRSLVLALAAALSLAGCGGGGPTESERGKGLFNFRADSNDSGASVGDSNTPGGGGSGTGGSGAGEAAARSFLGINLNANLAGTPVGVTLNVNPGLGGGSTAPSPIQEYATKVAACASGDVPETGLQGQVPALLRVTGFKGFSCNMELVGRYAGEGGNWSSATFKDNSGHHCAYHATSTAKPVIRINPGVPVIDITDPTRPVRTMSLTTPAMLDPWEGLRTNPIRQMLFAANAADGQGGPEMDIYDLSADCRAPQLLASAPMSFMASDGSTQPMKGHEGNISPDGMTYYVGDLTNNLYHAIDVTNATRPRLIATFDMKKSPIGKSPHGMSLSKDGTRLYAVAFDTGTPLDVVNPAFVANTGFITFDVSDIQARKPNPQFRVVSSVAYKDGNLAQHTLAIKVNGKPYVVMVDEAGSAGVYTVASAKAACAADMTPFPLARIYDMSDEKSPKVVSKLKLETHDPKNCDTVLPDVVDLAIFAYGSHYCSVDDTENATAMACSYFNSGVRVFDIRDPARPKEIAYFNPAGTTQPPTGSGKFNFGQWRPGNADWCAARLDFDKEKGLLTTMCHDNGLLVMKFKNGVWPFN